MPGILNQISQRNVIIVRPFGNAIPLTIAAEQIVSPFTALSGLADSRKPSEAESDNISIMPEAELSERFCNSLQEGQQEFLQKAIGGPNIANLAYGDSIYATSQQNLTSALLPPNYVIPDTIRIFNIICAEPIDAINRLISQPKETNLVPNSVKQIDTFSQSFDIIVLSGDSIGLS